MDTGASPKTVVSIFSILPQRDLRPFTRVTVNSRKENGQMFWGIQNTGSELIPGNPKHHCGPPLREREHGYQAINGVLAKVQFIVGSIGFQIHHVVIPMFQEE